MVRFETTTLTASAHAKFTTRRRPTWMVIVLGESIRYDHDLVVRNSTKLWKCCLGLFHGFAEVLRGVASRVLQICRQTTGFPYFTIFQKVCTQYSATTLRTTVPVKRVLFNQSRRPVSNRMCPPQEESTRKMVYNSWVSVENPTRRVAFYIIGSGYGASQTVMIEVRDKCLSAVANSVGGSSSPSSERVSYYLNQDKHIDSITNEVRRRGETQAIHSSGVLLRSATTFAYNGNSPTDDYTSFEFDIIDLLPESGYNQVRRPNVARLRCLFRLPADLNIDGPNPSSCFPDLQHSDQPRSVS